MNITGNKRYKETESKIHQSFLTLLEHKQIDEISVKDICQSAHLSRPAFYAHYEDINDLIINIEHEKSSRIADILARSNPLTIDDFINYVSYIKANKNFYIAFFQCENNLDISQSIMAQYLSVNQMSTTPVLKYHMLFFMAGLKAVVFEWLKKDCPESIGQIAQVLMGQYLLFIKNSSGEMVG